jgi:L-seryl-tRNA(Ser) seleniumtransferase
VGRAALIDRIRRDPLARAMRPDKVTLAAVGATLALYRAGLAEAEIPVWRMLAASPDGLRTRASTLVDRIGASATVRELSSTIGGGSLPGETLPSFGLAIRSSSADRLARRLRQGTPAVVARIAERTVIVDLRTVEPAQDAALAGSILAALASVGSAAGAR